MQLFLGDPGALGLVENQYGVVGLVRASLLVADEVAAGFVDPDWRLFATLALSGAKLVSFPEPLAEHHGKPGRVDDVPGDGVAVLEAFERRPVPVPDLAQLAATVAAALVRNTRNASIDNAERTNVLRRAARRLGRA
jgi:hypothetical protein